MSKKREVVYVVGSNPKSIRFREETPDPVVTVSAQRRRFRDESPVIILNRGWDPRGVAVETGADDGQ